MEYKTLPKYNKNQKQQFINRIEAMNEKQGLVDVTPDLVLGGLGGRLVDSAARGLSKAANMVSSRFYNPTTYRGLARNLSTKKVPAEVSVQKGLIPKGTSDVERLEIARAEMNPHLGGYFDPRTFQYMAKEPASKVHELQHAKDFIKGSSYGSSPGSNVYMFGETMLNKARFNRPIIPSDRLVNASEKLYRGNVGERNARFAEHLYNRGLDSAKLSTSQLDKQRKVFDTIENAMGTHGIKNTLDPVGIVTKRAIRDSLGNQANRNIVKAASANEFIQQKHDPLDVEQYRTGLFKDRVTKGIPYNPDDDPYKDM